jgi:hypothetical protein
MAFKKTESASSGSIPFFKEWVKEISPEYADFLDQKLMEPKSIKAVQSGKGYLINFDDEFMIFEWKSGSVGKAIKKLITDEQGDFLLLCFTKTKKGLSYEIGFDDEVEITITEDKYDEGIYYTEITSTIPSIAPNENRKLWMDIPMMEAKKPVVFKASKNTPSTKKPRSDGNAS